MASLERMEAALRAADAAGNVEDARALAMAIKQARLQPPQRARVTPEQAQEAALTARQSATPGDPLYPEEPSPMVSLGRGFMDIAQGIKQRALMTDPSALTEYTTSIQPELQAYRDAQQRTAGTSDVFRGIGQSTPGTVAGLMMPPGSGWVTRALMGGASTALPQFLSVSEQADPVSQALEVAGKTGAGALVGMAGSAIMDAGVAGATWGANKAFGLGKGIYNWWRALPVSSRGKVQSQVASSLQRVGLNWDDVDESVRTALMDDARDQLKTAGEIDPEILARRVLYEKFGFGRGSPASATSGQVTRNPQQWSFERDMARSGPTGAPLSERFYGAQETRLKEVPGELLAAAKGSPDPYTGGTAAVAAVKAKDRAQSRLVGRAYRTARGALGVNDELPPLNIDETLRDFRDVIPSPVKRRIREFLPDAEGNIKVPLTVREAEDLRKLINLRMVKGQPSNSAVATAGGRLKDAINEAERALGQSSGEAVDLFNRATSLARERFSGKAVVDDLLQGKVTAERVFPGLLAAGRDKFDETLKYLTTGSKAAQARGQPVLQDMQAMVVDMARQAAKKDNWSAFGEVLDKIGDHKLAAIFKGQEQQLLALRQFATVARDMTYTPKGAAPSPSAPFLLNMLRRMRPELGAALMQDMQATQVANALSQRAAQQSQPLYPAVLRDAALRGRAMKDVRALAGPLSGAAITNAANPFEVER